MVVVLVEVLNAQTSIAQAAWMVVVEVTVAFMNLIIAQLVPRCLYTNKHGGESASTSENKKLDKLLGR